MQAVFIKSDCRFFPHAMLFFRTLTRMNRLARLVLAWFALTLAVAALSPIVHPKPMQLVCSVDGAHFITSDGEKLDKALQHHTLDCAMCMAVMLPTPFVRAFESTPLPQGVEFAARAVARVAALAGPPLPARGPPGGEASVTGWRRLSRPVAL